MQAVDGETRRRRGHMDAAAAGVDEARHAAVVPELRTVSTRRLELVLTVERLIEDVAHGIGVGRNGSGSGSCCAPPLRGSPGTELFRPVITRSVRGRRTAE